MTAGTEPPTSRRSWTSGSRRPGERFKGRTGKDVLAPKSQDGDGDGNAGVNDAGAGFHHGGQPTQPAGGQPNVPPAGGGADVVQNVMQNLGIIKKEAA